MRRKLRKLAGLMPDPMLIVVDGQLFKTVVPRNHEKRLLDAFKKGGRNAVEKYIADFQDEWTEIKDLINKKED